MSADPNDCLVWCLIETPAQFDTLYHVTENQDFIDSYIAHPNDFIVNSATTKIKKDDGGFTEWKEVVCHDHPYYDEIVYKVKEALLDENYAIDFSENLNSKTKASLIKYQRKNQLPIGNLDIETLSSLNVTLDEGNTFSENSNYTKKPNQKIESLQLIDTISYTGPIYIGNKTDNLNFVDYLNKSHINPIDYDHTNPRHSIVIDDKYYELLAKDPYDFFDSDMELIYDVQNLALLESTMGEFIDIPMTNCVLIRDAERITAKDTMDFTSVVYVGDKVSKLNFRDHILRKKIKSVNYSPSNPRLTVSMDKQYEKLVSKNPEDFSIRENTVVYEKVIREGGIESFECLCPDDVDISRIESNVEAALKSKNFVIDNEFGEISKRSLAQFQLKHNRPIGVLDFETLDLLGVEY